MEKDYNAKLKYSKETVDEQIKEACRGILKEKDDEINKLGIKVGQHLKTLPKAQRTRGLSSSCQSNFLRLYHKS